MSVAPRFVVNQLGRSYFAVRDTVTELDVATTSDRGKAHADAEQRNDANPHQCPHCAAPADSSGCCIPEHDPRCPTRDPNF